MTSTTQMFVNLHKVKSLYSSSHYRIVDFKNKLSFHMIFEIKLKKENNFEK